MHCLVAARRVLPNMYFRKGHDSNGGGSAEFGWVIEDNFMRGSTGRSPKLNNPKQIPGKCGLEFEVYAILPLLPTSISNCFMED